MTSHRSTSTSRTAMGRGQAPTRAGALAATLAVGALLAAPTGALTRTPSTALSATQGMRIDGHLWRQHAGSFVSRAGDVNGDGLDDVLVGTSETHSSRGRDQSGSVFVVY